MKRTRNLMVLLASAALAIVVSHSAFAEEEESWVNQIIGVYYGTMVSSGSDCYGTTTFLINDDGKLAGTYDFLERNGRLYGTITDCVPAAGNRLSCTWHDEAGKGNLELTFNKELNSFNGFWGVPGSKARYPWNGSR